MRSEHEKILLTLVDNVPLRDVLVYWGTWHTHEGKKPRLIRRRHQMLYNLIDQIMPAFRSRDTLVRNYFSQDETPENLMRRHVGKRNQ